jgi:hypothetical protein
MGLITLTDLRTDLQTVLGNKGIAEAALDRYINFGYYDLAGAIEFEALTVQTALSTTASQAYINNATTPSTALVVLMLRDSTNDSLLGWVPRNEYFRRKQASTGVPQVWTRHPNSGVPSLFLHPVPNGVFSVEVTTIEPPTALSNGTDVSVLPTIYDPALFQLAVHHGLLAQNEEQRAMAWLGRAIAYLESRITETDFHESSRGLGPSIPKGLQMLKARAEGGQ